ncbi:MAG TPA: DegT/DnrJ/EryC1/StrS family aminotransferase [Bryobacteraceae bacterium]|nr:DegT/DnrJ/EryC1/StrS family aminotransferase [Bryobacteraceae bacterium]
MKIPLIKPDLPTLEEVREPIEEILANGRITNFGRYVTQFEAETGAFLNTRTIALSSGTMGLIFSLQGLGLKAGQKVIMPSFTFVATAQAALYAGGTPLFADIDEDLNISVSDLEKLLDQQGENVGAVIAVHMYGLPAKVREIEAVVANASKRLGRRIPLIFDGAHAFGSAVNGEKIGGFGDAEVFSLSVTKVLVTVEGGLVSSRNEELITKIRSMRNYGIQSNYNAHFAGLNGKMSEFHAIIGLKNLSRIECLLKERQTRAKCFREKIAKNTGFELSVWPDGVVHTFKDLTILVKDGENGRRDRIMEYLSDRGVETRAYFYPPVHEQAYFTKYADRQLPKTECLARRVITLPFFTSITTEQIDYMVETLRQAEKEVAA